LRLLKEKEKIGKDNKLEDAVLSLIQQAAAISKAKIRIVLGANRSGKSEFGGIDTCIQVTGVIPKCIAEVYPKDFIRNGKYWVSSLDFPSSRDITQDKVNKYLPKRFVQRFSKDDKIYFLTEGREIGFKSADSGREKYQGTSRYQVWMDEEHPKDVYDEAYMRTIDCSGRILLTFTPVEGLTWSYQELYLKAKRYYFTKNKHGIPEEPGIIHTLEEIKLLKDRELQVRENTDSSADPDIEVFQMSTYDNPHLPDIEIQRTERKWAEDQSQYRARVLGQYAKMSNRAVYPVEILLRGQTQSAKEFMRGEIVNGQFKKDHKGRLVLFKQKKPMGEGHYVIGADVAEGREDGDYDCAQILDHKTCEQVGIWHGRTSPENFASILIDVGRFFNNAWIAPERNFHGFGVVNRIREHKYNNLFSEYDVPQDAIKKGGATGGVKKYGWDTNAKTKPIMIQDLGEYIRQGHIRINDFSTYEELITYSYHADGSTGALRGCYDDRVIALAIALQVFKRRGIARFTPSENFSTRRVNPHTGYPV